MPTKQKAFVGDNVSLHWGTHCSFGVHADTTLARDTKLCVNAAAQFTADTLPATPVFPRGLCDVENQFGSEALIGFENGQHRYLYELSDPEQAATISHPSKGASIVCDNKPWNLLGVYSNKDLTFGDSKNLFLNLFLLFLNRFLKTPAKQVAEPAQHSSCRKIHNPEANQELEVMVDSLSQLVILVDSNLRIVRTNSILETWGYGQLAQVRGQHLTDFLRPLNNLIDGATEIDWSDVRNQLAVGQLVEWELDQVSQRRTLRLSLKPISANGRVQNNMEGCYAVLLVEDVTKRKTAETKLLKHVSELREAVKMKTTQLQRANAQLENELLESERAKTLSIRSAERYASFVESTLAGICIVREGRITYCNKRFAEVFGYPKLELFLKSFLDLVHPEDQSATACRFAEVTKKPVSAEEPLSIRARDNTGKLLWLHLSLSLRDKDIESGILVNVVDITNQKEAELTLRESEKQLHLLSCQLIEAQETERKRIACELHDSIGQVMGAIKYKVERIIMNSGNGCRTPHLDQLENVVTDIRGAMSEVRKIAMDLRPSMLDDLGVLLTIDWLCREFEGTYSGIGIEKQIAVEESAINQDRKLVVYRIVQEAMNNVIKYANAAVIRLELSKRENGIYLCISDNGEGFDMTSVPRNSCASGFGLRSMRERAELSGGFFNIKSDPGRGTSVEVYWPELAGSTCLLRD